MFLFFISWKGIRDDIGLLLEEDITSVNLCALHYKIRNTEQFLGSLGLFAFKIGSLESLNKALSKLGPNAMKKDFIRLKEGRNTNIAVNKALIKVASLSGPTERTFLANIDDIVKAALPKDHLVKYLNEDSAEDYLLKKVAFCEEMKKFFSDIIEEQTFTRDYGVRQEIVAIPPLGRLVV